MIVYKKAYCSAIGRYVIVRMRVNARQVVRIPGCRKMRSERAMVLSITLPENARNSFVECESAMYSHRCAPLRYVVGRYAVANGLNKNRDVECGKGINFFATRKEAVNY